MTEQPLLAQRLARPIQRFLAVETSSAIALLGATVFALVWANFPHYGHTYEHFWHQTLSLSFGAHTLSMGLQHWVNDGLMAIFFFVVGMEIKREISIGELASLKKALLPVLGAIGGMIVPALIYASFHWGGEAIRGWGVPMATDIAFAVAALSVFGSRVPLGLKIFLLALAIADDLGAVAVIAIFYSDGISAPALGVAAAILGFVYIMNLSGVRSYIVYFVIGGLAWYAMLESGVHATIAGVCLGLLTPTGVRSSRESLLSRANKALGQLDSLLSGDDGDHGGHHRHQAARRLSNAGAGSLSPVDYLSNLLHPWVAFGIMPLFALANAGVVLQTETLADLVNRNVALGVGFGLVIGKPLGVMIFSFLAVKFRVAVLPEGVNWSGLLGASILAGVGFTVALFVSSLAFGEAQAGFIAGSKIGILCGSSAATLLGMMWLSKTLPKTS